MPKEIVNPSHHGTSDAHNPVVSVGWDRHGTVQIGTVKDGDRSLDGWFTDLNREGVNRLIRILRKARDQAFGADA